MTTMICGQRAEPNRGVQPNDDPTLSKGVVGPRHADDLERFRPLRLDEGAIHARTPTNVHLVSFASMVSARNDRSGISGAHRPRGARGAWQEIYE
jgi:hypothetical protein